MLKRIFWSLILLILIIAYLALVAIVIIGKIDLANDINIQYILHIEIILSALAYMFFVETIYRTEEDKINGSRAYILSALFTLPVIIGRGIGIFYLSQVAHNTKIGIFNFYGAVSVSKTIELLSWTILFPLSVLFLAVVFYKGKGRAGKTLTVLCALSSICCFIAFMCIISSDMIYLWIGLMGWGVLFLFIIIFYIYRQVNSN